MPSSETPIMSKPEDAQQASNSSRTSAPPTRVNVIAFDNSKAGLQAVDKAKTEAIITEMSEGSSYYLNEERKLKQRQSKVEVLLEKKRQFPAWSSSHPSGLEKLRRMVDDAEVEIEAERCTTRIFAHMDMDMFYAAVEEKKNPKLKVCPLGVGSMSMLSTTNYVARQFGVRAGMAGFIGKKLCPDLVIVPTDFDSYKKEAEAVRRVAAVYDPNFVCIGLDELTMELTHYIAEHFPDAAGMCDRYKAAEAVMQQCRDEVFRETRLTASAGIAPTTSLAKMASNYNKPNGQHCLALESGKAIREYLEDKPARSVPGIGKSTDFILGGIGIHTLGEIYRERYCLAYLFTPKTFLFLFSSAIGGTHHCFADYDAMQGEEEATNARKSVGEECTFSALDSQEALRDIVHQQLKRATERMVRYELMAQQVVLKVKERTFHVKYHSRNVNFPTDQMDVLEHVVDHLLAPLLPRFATFRLVGVRLEKLTSRHERNGEAGREAPVGGGGIQRTLSDMLCYNRGKRAREGEGLNDAQVTTISSTSSDILDGSDSDVKEDDENEPKLTYMGAAHVASQRSGESVVILGDPNDCSAVKASSSSIIEVDDDEA